MKFKIAPTAANITSTFSSIEQLPMWETWHQQFGHVSYHGIKRLFDHKLINGLHINTNSPWPDCIPCTEAKLSQLPFGEVAQCISKPGELTHMDLWGKYPVQSINGNSYYLVMVNDASRFTTVEFLKSKAHAADKIKNYIAYLSARSRSPCALHMDRGTEFVNQPLKSWCDSRGIRLQLTVPYSPSQNGVAEHMNHTLIELVCAMLAAFKLPQFLWEPAVLHAAYLRNMSYTKVHPHATPYQIWYGIKPNMEYLREFGAPVWILLQGQNMQKKMLPKSQRHIYVGYMKGHIQSNIIIRKLIIFNSRGITNILTSKTPARCMMWSLNHHPLRLTVHHMRGSWVSACNIPLSIRARGKLMRT